MKRNAASSSKEDFLNKEFLLDETRGDGKLRPAIVTQDAKKKKAVVHKELQDENAEGPPSVHVRFRDESNIEQIHYYSPAPSSESVSQANEASMSFSEDDRASNHATEEVPSSDNQALLASTSSGRGTMSATAAEIEEQAHLQKHHLPIENQHIRVLDAYANAGTILYTKRCRLSDVESSNEQREIIKPSLHQMILTFAVIAENLIRDVEGRRFQLVVLTSAEVIIYEELQKRLHNAQPQSIIERILHKERMILDFDGKKIYAQKEHFSTLHNFMLKNLDLPEIRCCYYFAQMVQIVAFMHEKGAVLRDISMRRWVFTDQEKLTLALGTFVDMQLLGTPSIDADDTLMERFGCAAYMSPEMLSRTSGTWSGRAADVWALGVCLFVFLTKRFPYYHITAQGLFRKIRQADLVFPAERPVSPKAQDLIQKLLQRDPRRRPRANEILGHPWIREVMPDYPVATVEAEAEGEIPVSYTSVGMPSFDHVDFEKLRIADDEEDSRTIEDSEQTIKATEKLPPDKMEH